MHAALKVIGASSETRHVPAGEPISGISEQGSKGINTPKWIWKYLFAFDEEGVCKQGFTNRLTTFNRTLINEKHLDVVLMEGPPSLKSVKVIGLIGKVVWGPLGFIVESRRIAARHTETREN